jgi:peptidyl-prolyl cis-trans isomerase B (cyclophilin B)
MLNRLVNINGRFSRVLKMVVFGVFVGIIATSYSTTAKEGNPVVVMETTKGKITIELYEDKAPVTVENFLWYVDNEFYNGLIFHRVIENFMIQGGGMTKDLVKKQGRGPIKNEADNGVKNARGTIAMARTSEVNSATSQFFINLKDNDLLNFKDKTARGYGYCVFGAVIDGLDVVDEIAVVKVADKSGHQNVPTTAVVINKAYRGEAPKKTTKKEEAKKEEAKEE